MMPPEIPFDDIQIGETHGPIELLMDEELVKQYCEDHDDHNPIYSIDSPFGGLESQTVDQNGVRIRHGLEHLLIGLKKRHDQKTEGYDAVREFVFHKDYSPDGNVFTVKGNLGIGMEIPSLTKIAWQRALHEKAFLSDSIHDDKYTRSHGYAGPLVSGYILNEYMSQMLLDFFGPYWLKGGVISQNFINGGVQEGDLYDGPPNRCNHEWYGA